MQLQKHYTCYSGATIVNSHIKRADSNLSESDWVSVVIIENRMSAIDNYYSCTGNELMDETKHAYALECAVVT